MKGLEDVVGGGTVRKVEYMYIGAGRDVVSRQPLIFLGCPLVPERFIGFAVPGQRAGPAVGVGGIGPDHRVQQRARRCGTGADALHQDNSGRARGAGSPS